MKNQPFITVFLISLLFICQSFSAQAKTLKIFRDIPYTASGKTDKRQQLDIYAPADATPNHKAYPVHIYVHGGAWRIGDKKMIDEEKAQNYTDADILLVAINYRLSPAAKHPDHINDCATAVKWVIDHIAQYGGDADNIVLSGHSAGAHLVALLGAHPAYLKSHGLEQDIFQAVIPVDTATFDLTRPYDSKLPRFIRKSREIAFGETRETHIDASPILQVRENATLSPFVIFVTAERKDAVSQSKLLEQTLKKNGHDAKAVVIESASHRQMNLSIFDTNSVIFQTIVQILHEGQSL